jgi:phage tail sheath gpL-like
MALFSLVRITHNELEVDMVRLLHAESGNRFLAGQKLMRYVRSLMGGGRYAKVEVAINAAKASGTITLSSHVATDTVTVNGIVFTCVASGATGNQYNVGADDTATAVALAAAINANATLLLMVVATSALGVVTLTALYPGALGNAVTLAISAHGSVSAARMAGGDNGAQSKTHYYGSQDPTA